MTDTPATDRLFIALASVIASIEAGSIAEGEVEDRRIDGDIEQTLAITVRRDARPLLPLEP